MIVCDVDRKRSESTHSYLAINGLPLDAHVSQHVIKSNEICKNPLEKFPMERINVACGVNL